MQKGGSGDAAGARKARPQNGRVPAGTAAAAAPRGKKPGVLSQSASFPARGATAATAVAKKAAAAVAATPKQAKGAAVANGSEAAAGLDAGFPSSLYSVWVCSVCAASVVSS